jgi:pyruvate carboxylase
MQMKKLLVANRSEIATRIFRSAHELGIRTVAIYSHEDRFALHRFKADEAYPIGRPGEPLRSYLDIQAVVDLARQVGADAVHPGYGFLSENADFAEALERAGIAFVGPSVHSLRLLGDKVAARSLAKQVGVPVLEGSRQAVSSLEEARQTAAELGYPVMLKASKGGGGRGMRIVENDQQLADSLPQAQREALSAFGSDEIFLEKLVRRARHIEVQVLGDRHGQVVHLFERDCSVQRRHQKVVELAPSPNLDPGLARQLHEASLAIARQVDYHCAGTFEYLLDVDSQQFYFIEVNPRIQVEHTVTEEVTGVDLVRAQLMVTMGAKIGSDADGLPSQDDIRCSGFAMQCRVTTEDPRNQFRPDYGRITHYRSGGGLGVRLDAGSAFSGAVVNPFYDSMLVKVTVRGRHLAEAARRMERCLQEFRIRGVKTNIPFLIKLVTHPTFLAGEATTRMIDQTPELFELPKRRDRATRLLRFIGDVLVNGPAGQAVGGPTLRVRREPAPLPKIDLHQPLPRGTRDIFLAGGPKGLVDWIGQQSQLLLTDTTMRDAHQSLLATRLRTYDLLQIAEGYSRLAPDLFSLEMWGGATFDTSLRFLKEHPFERLSQLRAKIPNILFQMLLRASNAVGYTNYPDNVVQLFVREAAQAGMDLFRVFDALNWTDNMRVAMEAVLESGMLCEAAICYTGDILNPARSKYDLKYYVQLARELERMGAHLLAIKDMAGLCKPEAAKLLVSTLRQEIGIPIHFHTHDTAGTQAAAILAAADQGLQIADAAFAPLSGGTSQVNLNTLVEALRFTPRQSPLQTEPLTRIANYWKGVREFYAPFESEALVAAGDLYQHEMPGGQYTNLYQQAKAIGLSERWPEICQSYADTNQLLGDIVKVTPTSKAVGDLALFLVSNNLTPQDLLTEDRELSFPSSVIDLVSGMMGQPPGGFPAEVKRAILRDKPEVLTRPGEVLPAVDIAAQREELSQRMGIQASMADVATHLMYPRVFDDFLQHRKEFGDVSVVPTPTFFFGPDVGEEVSVDIEAGKRLIIKFLTMGDARADGTRTVFFELNGQAREVEVVDQASGGGGTERLKADPSDPTHVAANMPGMVISIAVKLGDHVKRGQKLLALEAMKMETLVQADRDAVVETLHVVAGQQVESGDLLMVLK